MILLSSSQAESESLSPSQLSNLHIVLDHYEKQLTIKSNIIYNLEYELYLSHVIQSNLYGQIDVLNEIDDKESQIARLEGLQRNTKAFVYGAGFTAAVITVLKLIFKY
jgi:hypothetical protein